MSMRGRCHSFFLYYALTPSFFFFYLKIRALFSDDLAYNEKRSAHNALERQRREGLNSKFQELAHVLPSLKQVTRPSKSLIVAKSLEFGIQLYIISIILSIN